MWPAVAVAGLGPGNEVCCSYIAGELEHLDRSPAPDSLVTGKPKEFCLSAPLILESSSSSSCVCQTLYVNGFSLHIIEVTFKPCFFLHCIPRQLDSPLS